MVQKIVTIIKMIVLIAYIVDCGMPQFSNATLDLGINYGSTLEDSAIQFRCKEGWYSNEPLIAICHHSGTWMPNPESFECKKNNHERGIKRISYLVV